LRLSERELQQANEWRVNQANILMFEDLLKQASQLLDYQGETNSVSRQQNAEDAKALEKALHPLKSWGDPIITGALIAEVNGEYMFQDRKQIIVSEDKQCSVETSWWRKGKWFILPQAAFAERHQLKWAIQEMSDADLVRVEEGRFPWYDITWTKKPLGFSVIMARSGNDTYVSSIQDHKNSEKGVTISHQIVEVNGMNVCGKKHADITRLIIETPPPVTIRFQHRFHTMPKYKMDQILSASPNDQYWVKENKREHMQVSFQREQERFLRIFLRTWLHLPNSTSQHWLCVEDTRTLQTDIFEDMLLHRLDYIHVDDEEDNSFSFGGIELDFD